MKLVTFVLVIFLISGVTACGDDLKNTSKKINSQNNDGNIVKDEKSDDDSDDVKKDADKKNDDVVNNVDTTAPCQCAIKIVLANGKRVVNQESFDRCMENGRMNNQTCVAIPAP